MPKAAAPPTAMLAAKSEKSLQMSGLLAKIKDPAAGGAQKQFSNKQRAQLSPHLTPLLPVMRRSWPPRTKGRIDRADFEGGGGRRLRGEPGDGRQARPLQESRALLRCGGGLPPDPPRHPPAGVTFIEAGGADGAPPTMVARDGGGGGGVAVVAGGSARAGGPPFESLQSLIYTAEDGRVISDRVVGWEWSKDATRLVVRTGARLPSSSTEVRLRRRRDLLRAARRRPSRVGGARGGGGGGVRRDCALDRCAVQLVKGASRPRPATASPCGSGRAACR